jgi:hypothetical protein
VSHPKTYDELVTWATWQVIEGIATGKSLRSVLYSVLEAVRRWAPEEKTDAR